MKTQEVLGKEPIASTHKASRMATLALPERQISIDAAASAIGVSTATIRNWIKAGYLDPIATRPLVFEKKAVLNLKNKLASGQIGRLKSRANKSASLSGTVPTEYAESETATRLAAFIVDEARLSKLSIQQTLFMVAFYILLSKGEITANTNISLKNIIRTCQWKRQCVKDEMEEWLSTFPPPKTELHPKTIKLIYSVTEEDFLGLLYQSLSNEGDRSTSGSYYTPLSIVKDVLTTMAPHASSFLDPCCGTGQFLIQAASFLSIPTDRIYGFDIDRTAVRIARINILLAVPDMKTRPNIEYIDYLSDQLENNLFSQKNSIYREITLLATNPPWGSYKNNRLAEHLKQDISSGETFALFISQSLKLLSPGAAMSFILPESILNVKIHADIRKTIVDNSTILRIIKMGRQFSGVYTPVIRIDLVKRISYSNCIDIHDGNAVRHVDQNRFKSNALYTFDIDVTNDDDDLLEYIYNRALYSLRGRAEWALGIVTGNNKLFLSSQKDKGMEEIYKGSDIYPFALAKAKNFIIFQPDQFQQVAKEHLYRASEKLIYKFISKRLVFAYDDKQKLTLNSANILIPNIPGMSIKTVMAFLNSDLYQYIFRTKFSTCKILKGNLESLPFPQIDKTTDVAMTRYADLAIMGDSNAATYINSLVCQAFELSNKQISYVETCLRRNQI